VFSVPWVAVAGAEKTECRLPPEAIDRNSRAAAAHVRQVLRKINPRIRIAIAGTSVPRMYGFQLV